MNSDHPDFTHASSSRDGQAPAPPLLERFAGLRVAITGGTSGLGLALVRELSRRGADIAFAARTGSRVLELAADLGVHGITADVARKHDIHALALQIVGALGGVDVLINNASDL